MSRATTDIAGMFLGFSPNTRPALLVVEANTGEHRIQTGCPKCGRNHVTVFKLRHLKDSFFQKLGEFYAYDEHNYPESNERCSNSGKNPNWGGPAAPPR